MNPSLLLIPDRYKAAKLYSQIPNSGDGDLEFTRALDTATRVNASGLIEAVASGIPRIDYTGGGCGKLLLEPQRTNIFYPTEDLSNAAWIKVNTTITPNTTVSPDGTTTADSVVLNVGTVVKGVAMNRTMPTGNANGSFFIKRNTLRYFQIQYDGTTEYCNFDLQTLTAGTPQNGAFNPEIEIYGDYVRIGLTRTSTPITSRIPVLWVVNSLTSAAFEATSLTGTFECWGGNVVESTYMSSYIPATSASVTRSADAASKTGISSLIGQTSGTLFYDGFYGNEINEVYLFLQKESSTTVEDSIYIQQSSGAIALNVYVGATQQVFIIGGSFTIGQRIKIAAAYSSNDFVLYVNGTQIGTDNAGSVPTCGALQLASYRATPTAANFIAVKGINTAALYPVRLSNADLQTLTTL